MDDEEADFLACSVHEFFGVQLEDVVTQLELQWLDILHCLFAWLSNVAESVCAFALQLRDIFL